MHNLRRFYYQNKKKIWQIILFIAFIIILIQLLNYITKINNNDYNYEENRINQTIDKNNSSKNTEIVSGQSAVSGEKIENSTIEETQKILEEFINFCNNKEIDKAYNLLSTECKTELYSSKEEFKNKYIKNNFPEGSKKIAKIENWIGNIYKINISEDIMATGNINNDTIQDYITIVNENNQKKLNINSFVDKEKINKTSIQDNVEIKITSRDVYMDYEKYTITINNKTENSIMLDSLNSTKTIYLEDENGTKYYAYTQEIVKEELKVNAGFSTQISIKFYKTYSSTRQAKQLVFSNFILNYNNYINGNKDTSKFIVSL